MKATRDSASEKLRAIRLLNDTFRKGERQDGVTVITPSVRAKGEEFVAAARDAVRRFDRFELQTDRNGEHAIGMLHVCGEAIRFEIRYLDLLSTAPAIDPADILSTRRVLEIKIL